jgi:hypothetical protein
MPTYIDLTCFVCLLAIYCQLTAAKNRTVHELDIPALIKRVMIDTYTVDPQFMDFVSHPSAFYTDLYGIHALHDFTREQILADFVPRYGNLSQETATTLVLKFHSGWDATFYPHAILNVKGHMIPRDHVFISGANASELIANLKDFRRILDESSTSSKYLVFNPSYQMENIAATMYYNGKSTLPIPTDGNMTRFLSLPDAILIYPDEVHGDLASYNIFMEKLKTSDIQWLGMEMLPSAMQLTIDQFCTAPVNSSAYLTARQALADYFVDSWTPYFKLNITSGDQSPYFKAIDLMRQKNGRVYGLDLADLEFILFRYGESNFGASVRSYNWATSVPMKGRGIIFGGSSHFTMNRSGNVQDYLNQRNTQLPLFSIRTLRPSAAVNQAHTVVSHSIVTLLVSICLYLFQ